MAVQGLNFRLSLHAILFIILVSLILITASDLLSLFSQGHYSKVISEGLRAGFTPGMNPDESRVIAAAYFRNGSYFPGLILWIIIKSQDG